MALDSHVDEQLRAAENVPRVLDRLASYYRLTDTRLSEELGMKRTTLRSKRTGESVATVEELARFAGIFGVPPLVFYLDPDEAVRWVLDHPNHRPEWLVAHLDKSRKSCCHGFQSAFGNAPLLTSLAVPA